MQGKGYALGLGLVLLMALAAAAGARAAVSSEPARLMELQYLRDASGQAKAEEVLRADAQWHYPQGRVPSFGFTDAAIWLRARLPEALAGSWLLEVANPALDWVEVYRVRDDHAVLVYRTGEMLPFAERPVPHRHFLFPLQLDGPPEGGEILLRVQSSGALQIPLSLLPARALLQRVQIHLLLQGLYFGGLLALLLYNLVAFVLLRERSYLYLLGFIASIGLFQAGLQGLSYQFLWPGAPAWNNRSLSLFVVLAVASASAFTRCFLQLHRRRPRLGRLLQLMTGLALVLVPFTLLLPHGLTAPTVTVLAMAAAVAALLAGLGLWRFSALARFFTLVWLATSVGALLMAFNKFGWLPRTFLTENALQLGSALAALLLSAALARRFNRERTRRQRAQGRARQLEREAKLANRRVLELQEQMESGLAERVRQRTRLLEQRVDELEARNAALEAGSYIDELTGLKNRRFFDERYRIEWRRAFRGRYPLALVLIDIDGLKEINDRLGRAAGDERLQEVARVVAELAARPADTVARFAEDEFAVLMAGTPPAGARHLAEAIRRRVESLGLPGAEERVTVSAGVAAVTPSERHHEAILLSFADDALYRARAGGPNGVTVFELPPASPQSGARPA